MMGSFFNRQASGVLFRHQSMNINDISIMMNVILIGQLSAGEVFKSPPGNLQFLLKYKLDQPWSGYIILMIYSNNARCEPMATNRKVTLGSNFSQVSMWYKM